MASDDQLAVADNTCAICWDPMEAARKLPCGHLFHNWCLREWLEQDTSCPTCRLALTVGGNPPAPEGENGMDAGDQGANAQTPRRGRRGFNHFFHFDGGRYARWLPSFSVEVHNLGGPAIFARNVISNSQYNTLAERVREMFPHVPLELILENLHETGSTDTTVENILEGRLQPREPGLTDESSGEDEESEDEEASDWSAHDLAYSDQSINAQTDDASDNRLNESIENFPLPATSAFQLEHLEDLHAPEPSTVAQNSTGLSTRRTGSFSPFKTDTSQSIPSLTLSPSRSVPACSLADSGEEAGPSTSATRSLVDSAEEPARAQGGQSTSSAGAVSPVLIGGSRFSKSSAEREGMLEERKRNLIDFHRKRYFESERGRQWLSNRDRNETSNLSSSTNVDSELSPTLRQRLPYHDEPPE